MEFAGMKKPRRPKAARRGQYIQIYFIMLIFWAFM
jgi:hypothetical protein